jgi:uncharacterized protein YjbI with pentapeptide repeats
MKKYFWVFLLLIAGFILALWIIPWGVQVTNNYAGLQNGKEKFEASLEISKAIIGGVGTSATIVGGVFLFLNFRIANRNLEIANKNLEQAKRKNDLDEKKSQKDIEIAESRLITDRFSKATEQLASNSLHTRLGAIYSLEGIAKDDEKYYWIVIEILSAFIRREKDVNISQSQEEKTSKTPVDIQAALTVIIRRDIKSGIEQKTIDLSGAILNDIDLSGKRLENINLRRSTLHHVILFEAKLINVDFIEAELFDTNFQRANIDDSNFNAAHLTKVNFVSTRVNKTTFEQAILKGTEIYKDTYFDVDGFSPELKQAFQNRGATICNSFEESRSNYFKKLVQDHISDIG